MTELLNIPRDGIDYETGEAVIGHSKTGDPILLSIPDAALTLLKQADKETKPGRISKSAFGYVSRSNVYRAITEASKKAGIKPFRKTHSIGRHAFASRLLAQGKSVKFVADAGRWKSQRLVLDTYGHLERQDVDRDVKELGDEWGKARQLTQKE